MQTTAPVASIELPHNPRRQPKQQTITPVARGPTTDRGQDTRPPIHDQRYPQYPARNKSAGNPQPAPATN